MKWIGLFTLHQKKPEELLGLLKKYGELYVHSRGDTLFKIVPLSKNKIAEDMLFGVAKVDMDNVEAEKLKSTVEAKLHSLIGDNDPE